LYNRPNLPSQNNPEIIYLRPGYVGQIKPEHNRPHVNIATPVNRPPTETQPSDVSQRPTVGPILPPSYGSVPSSNRGTIL
jgi:hypothetical protein